MTVCVGPHKFCDENKNCKLCIWWNLIFDQSGPYSSPWRHLMIFLSTYSNSPHNLLSKSVYNILVCSTWFLANQSLVSPYDVILWIFWGHIWIPHDIWLQKKYINLCFDEVDFRPIRARYLVMTSCFWKMDFIFEISVWFLVGLSIKKLTKLKKSPSCFDDPNYEHPQE